LRPIMMTSLAFILGVVPLMLSAGAGAEMRQTLGTAVFSGMLGVTLFGIFLTPVFYYVIQWFSDKRAANRPADEDQEESEKPHGGHPNGDGHPGGDFTFPADGKPVGASANGHGAGHPHTTTHASH
jgi:multidrug efflux pump